MSIEFVTSTADFESYLKSNKYVLANFTASWCGPCQAIKPVLDQFYTDSSDKYIGIEMIKIDIDEQAELASKYEITSVPTFLCFEDRKIVAEIKGANIQELLKQLDKMTERATKDNVKRKGNPRRASFVEAKDVPLLRDIALYIPKGYEVLNDNIHFGEFESLNIQSLQGDGSATVKDVFNKMCGPATIYTDADSQGLLYIPFMNISKIYSILIKLTDKATINVEKSKLDDEEIEVESQPPNLIKVWPNLHNILSFDDASLDGSAAHAESIDKFGDDGWYEVKLKFVRFQNVQSLNIFIEGDDEDYHTLIDKIIIIGINGDTKDQGKIQKLDDE